MTRNTRAAQESPESLRSYLTAIFMQLRTKYMLLRVEQRDAGSIYVPRHKPSTPRERGTALTLSVHSVHNCIHVPRDATHTGLRVINPWAMGPMPIYYPSIYPQVETLGVNSG